MHHPRERYGLGASSRRDFLVRAGGLALAAGGAGPLLAACGNETAGGGGGDPGGSGTGGELVGPGGIPLARRDRPVRLPLYDDNPAIEAGLEAERGGVLNIYNWADYLWKKVANDFGKKYDVKVQIATFNNMDEALAKLSTGAVSYDIMFPTVDVLPKMVAGKLLQPLNLDYIPALQKNVWPQLADPFYDQGSQYTVPYTVYTTGIGWRDDLYQGTPPSELDNPYDAFWEATWADGKVALLDDAREAMGMTLLRNGIDDVNTERPEDIELVKSDLLDLSDRVNVKTAISGYQTVPTGSTLLHQVWSGDLVGAQYYVPKGVSPKLLRYWTAGDGAMIGSDTIAILKSAKKPVLAHLFLNFMLEEGVALENFGWVGYQPPLQKLVPDRLVADGYIPANLDTAIVREGDFETGNTLLGLTSEGDALWQNAWSEFKAGV
jgi:spermidine/putrescine transport system substrate-binding protein